MVHRDFDVAKWSKERECLAREAFESWKEDNKEVIEELRNE